MTKGPSGLQGRGWSTVEIKNTPNDVTKSKNSTQKVDFLAKFWMIDPENCQDFGNFFFENLTIENFYILGAYPTCIELSKNRKSSLGIFF